MKKKKVKAFLWAIRFGVLLAGMALIAAGQEPLTNDSIMKMIKAGLGEKLIVEMIGSHQGNYDLSADAVVGLKQQGVSDPILDAMIAKGVSPPAATAVAAQSTPPAADAEGPPCPNRRGVYYLDGGKWKAMSEVLMAGRGTKVVPVPIFTSAKAVARYRDPAALVTLSNNPRFCVAGSAFPRNLAIASLDVKRDHREIQMAEGHAFTGVTSGLPEKKLQAVEIKPVSNGVVQVVMKAPLNPGQYMLFPHGIASAGYDFGVEGGGK